MTARTAADLRPNFRSLFLAATLMGVVAVSAYAFGLGNDSTGGGGPVASPSVGPSASPGRFEVVLLDQAANRVVVAIEDRSGRLIAARAAQVGEGASVPWTNVVIENTGTDTLRVTWSGLPADAGYGVAIDQRVRSIVVARPASAGDAMPVDRGIELEFRDAVSASDVSGAIRGVDQPAPSDQPSASPSLAPSADPSPTAKPSPTARPTATPSQSLDPADRPHVFVDLIDGAGRTITIEIGDRSGLLVAARSGDPKDGASVPNGEITVENNSTDTRTLILTWAGASLEDHVLTIDGEARTFRVSGPKATGDSLPGDRVVILEFSQAVPAEEVEAIFQEGMDSIG